MTIEGLRVLIALTPAISRVLILLEEKYSHKEAREQFDFMVNQLAENIWKTYNEN